MVGHIAFPEMSRKYCPNMTDEEIMPATLSPELIKTLLRDDMNFNGVVITDATHMVGMTAMAKRSEAIPGAIEAGCDMILFANDVDEDIQFVKDALKDGRLKEERLDEAVTRILAMKAHLNLNKEELLIPSKDNLKVVGCEEHKNFSKEAAENCITLVKDTRNYLPLNPKYKKRCFLVYIGASPVSKGWKDDPVKQVLIEELEKAGFEVDACPSFHELEVKNGVSYKNNIIMMNHSPRKDFVLLVIKVKGYAQENWVRLRWSCNHSMELPWYNEEIPTIGMSLNYTNHLIDIPQIHTFINAYSPDRVHIQKAVEKLVGKSEFKGHAEDYVFCDRWDTRV